jgi:hypothetical protein
MLTSSDVEEVSDSEGSNLEDDDEGVRLEPSIGADDGEDDSEDEFDEDYHDGSRRSRTREAVCTPSHDASCRRRARYRQGGPEKGTWSQGCTRQS